MPTEAVSLQRESAQYVIRNDCLGQVESVAGFDVGFEAREARAAVAVLSFTSLELVDQAIIRTPIRFPYVPGLLSFREIPAVLAALRQFSSRPDLLLCDGQGIADPRRCGVASHLGLVSGIQSRLIGEHNAVSCEKGAWMPLRHHGEVISAVLRTRAGVAPLFVSIGHRVSLSTAIAYVPACTTRYRLPETTRWGHRLASGPPTTKRGRR